MSLLFLGYATLALAVAVADFTALAAVILAWRWLAEARRRHDDLDLTEGK